MKKSLVVVLAGYVGVVSTLSVLNVDADFREVLAGPGVVVLGSVLALFYAVVAGVSVWLVTLLTSFTCRLVATELDALATAPLIHHLMVLAMVCRLPALVGQQWWGTSLPVVTLVIPLVVALLGVRRLPRVRGVRGVIALAPFLVYLAGDAALIVMSP